MAVFSQLQCSRVLKELLHFFRAENSVIRNVGKCLICHVSTEIFWEQSPRDIPRMGKTTRVVVCGMKGVGKTALLEQLIYGNVTPKTEIHPTIEDIYVANIETDRGTKEKVRFYDTAGLESLQSNANNQQLPRHYLGFADGYVLVYDIAKPESLDVLLPLKKDIDRNKDKKEVTVIVIGNRTKSEVEINSIENTASKAANWCTREKIRHYEVNVMDRTSLFEAFIHLSSRLNPPTNKSTFPQLSMGRKTVKVEAP